MLINDLDWSNFCIGLINELDSTGLIFEQLDSRQPPNLRKLDYRSNFLDRSNPELDRSNHD